MYQERMTHTHTHTHTHTYLELHPGEMVDDISQLVLDDGPGDLVLRLGGVLHSSLGKVVEGNNVLQHTHSLVKWAIAVIGSVRVLLEEVILDQLGYLKSDLV